MSTRYDPVLIGPVGAGKTSVAARLASALGVAHVEYDALRRGYFEELGFDMALNLALHEKEGWATMYRYWKVFSPYAIERMLDEHRGVLDLGGGAVVCEHADVLTRLQRAFAPFANVVFLRPYADLDRTLAVLDARTGHDPVLSANNRRFLENPAFATLATLTVDTGNRGVEAVAAEVLDRLVRP
ncbi:MAG: hypothetical protein EP330_01590 [Deltaproteobacteria bacterium]|nr:MAG: hypothetical protein EP330_01590 [Deltaproteobacteria bacterium]